MTFSPLCVTVEIHIQFLLRPHKGSQDEMMKNMRGAFAICRQRSKISNSKWVYIKQGTSVPVVETYLQFGRACILFRWCEEDKIPGWRWVLLSSVLSSPVPPPQGKSFSCWILLIELKLTFSQLGILEKKASFLCTYVAIMMMMQSLDIFFGWSNPFKRGGEEGAVTFVTSLNCNTWRILCQSNRQTE